MKLAILVVAALLAGCNATMNNPQRAYRPTAADDPSTKCFDQLATDDRFAVLRPKIGSPSRASESTMGMLASQAKPTEEEKRWIGVWAVARQTCVDMGRSFRAQHAPPGWTQAYDAGQSDILILISRLWGSEITYGQFNRERREMAAKYSGLMTAASLGQQAREQQMAQQQAQQRSAEAANALILMQAIQPPRPVNCTSYALGHTVQTNCR